jgi:FlaA1/EpsC-like NDP-sugar epimerase
MRAPQLQEIATGRARSFFEPDFVARHGELAERLGGRRVLVIGGAGSIGAATIAQLVQFAPDAVHVLDVSENMLAELVRDLRSRRHGLDVRDFRTLPLDFGSTMARRFLEGEEPYDYVLNFAALKHVRSEKDPCSLLQMLDTNVVKASRFIERYVLPSGARRYFAVSTDKAANAVSVLGASKRLMEMAMFDGLDRRGAETPGISSARFANVAFSEGSLLQSFMRRMDKRQPLSVPRDTRRYFVSLEESGQICLIAAMLCPDHHLLVPRMAPQSDLRELVPIAASVVQQAGFAPKFYEDEDAARASVDEDMLEGHYPVLLTPLDTSGEKPYEEFFARDEVAVDVGFLTLHGVRPAPGSAAEVTRLIAWLDDLISRPDASISKQEIVERLTSVVTDFHHRETGKNLDQRI